MSEAVSSSSSRVQITPRLDVFYGEIRGSIGGLREIITVASRKMAIPELAESDDDVSDAEDSDIEDIGFQSVPVATSGIPDELHPLITKVQGTVAKLADANIVLLRDSNHLSDSHQNIHRKFVNTCLKRGDIVMQEGVQRRQPVPVRHSLIEDPLKRMKVIEVGWDDMDLHNVATKDREKHEGFVSKRVSLRREIERLRDQEQTDATRKQIADLKASIEASEEEQAKWRSSEEHEYAEWATVTGRNVSLLKTIRTYEKARRLVQLGGGHVTRELLDKLKDDKVMIITFEDIY